jgi:hypothetical protein
MKRVACFIVPAGLGLLGGCQFHEMLHDRTVMRVNENTDKGFKEVAGELKVIAPSDKLQELQAVVDKQNTRIAEDEKFTKDLFEKARSEYLKKVEFVEELAGAAATAVGGPGGAALGQKIVAGFEKLVGVSKDAADTAKVVETHTQAVSKIASDVTDLKATIARNRDELDQLVARNPDLKAKFDALDVTLKDKLAAVRGTMDDQIAKILKDNPNDAAKVREEIEKILGDRGFTRQEIDGLKGISTNELLLILLGSGAAAGTGGILAKTGKSRSQPEIDGLKQDMNTMRVGGVNRPQSDVEALRLEVASLRERMARCPNCPK